MKNNLWVYSYSEENFSYSDEFATKEEAIKEAKEDSNIGEKVYVGVVREVQPSGVDIERMLEQVADHTIDGCDFGEDYLMHVEKEHEEELEEKMNEVLFDWMKKHNYLPDWFLVEDIEEVKIR